MNTGRIRWFSPDRSHGFILLPDGQEAYFNAFDFLGDECGQAQLGDEVSFELLKTETGFEAFSIQTLVFSF